MARLSVFLIAVFLALLPATSFAQENEVSDGYVLRIEGDLTVPEGETVDAAVVIDGIVHIDGTVEDFLVVVDGYTEVTGRVNGDILSISSNIDVRDGAVVDGDINLIDGSVHQEAGARVLGEINDDISLDWWEWLLLNIVIWIGMSIAVLAFGLLLVAAAPRQAAAAAAAMTADLGYAVLSALIAFVGVPVLAVIALITVIGLPLGLGVLLFLLPALWFVGYLVAGVMLGTLVYSRAAKGVRGNRYLVAFTGLAIFQLLALIPFAGILVVLLAGLWGAGAIVLLAWRSFRWPRSASPPLPA